MKYFKIDRNTFIKENNPLDLVPCHANGESVSNGKSYFERIGKEEIIYDAPVFDHFHLESYDKKEHWEWRVQDVHGFLGDGPTGGAWYVSDKCKKLFEQFKIAKDYHFYATKLLYKGGKLDYWIFQFPINPYQNIDFQRSEFTLKDDDKIYKFASEEEYLSFFRQEYRATKRKLAGKKVSFTGSFDLAHCPGNIRLASEELKNAIESSVLDGFEFFEIDFEVEMPAR